MSAKRILVIGGSAAGPKAAAKARRLDETADIVLLQREADLSMASCGYPYYVGGFFDDRNQLLCTATGVVRDTKYYLNAKAIDARTNTEATEIIPKDHAVSYKNLATGDTGKLEYDKLILATGASARMPPVPGINLKGITTMQSMRDADFLRKIRDEGKVKKAVVVGGGLIGIETCEALHLAGIEITVVEMMPQLLLFLDWEMAKLVENHVRAKGANVISGNGVAEFLGTEGVLTGIKLQNGTELDCELAVIAIGVKPNVELARNAGLTIGAAGGISVDEHLRTSERDIYAIGDCIEIPHRITGKKILAPYGDLANLEGRIAGENAITGDTVTFPGTIQTGICKVFDFAAGSTGLSETVAAKNGYPEAVSVVNASPDKPGFMDGKLLVTKLVADRATGKILGAQVVGPGNVSKQIAQWALSIQGNLTVEDITNADLPYAPPFSLAIDHFIATAHLMQNKMKNRLKGISVTDVKRKLDAGEKPFILDVRGADEYEAMRLGIGETLIPLGALRKRISELPQNKEQEMICYCKISLRGYEAALVLEANGWKNVRVMEGGIMAWPYPREK